MKTGERAVVDAYAAFRHLVVAGYGKTADLLQAVVSFEAKPESAGRRDTLTEELKSAGALDDPNLLAAAENVLNAAETSGASIGLDWEDVKAARLKLGKVRVRAGAIGFRAARMEIAGEIEISEIDVAGAHKGK